MPSTDPLLSDFMVSYGRAMEERFVHQLWMDQMWGGILGFERKLTGVAWGGAYPPDFTTALCENTTLYDHGIPEARSMIEDHLRSQLEAVADEWGIELCMRAHDD